MNRGWRNWKADFKKSLWMLYREIEVECKMRYFTTHLVDIPETGNTKYEVEGGGNFQEIVPSDVPKLNHIFLEWKKKKTHKASYLIQWDEIVEHQL